MIPSPLFIRTTSPRSAASVIKESRSNTPRASTRAPKTPNTSACPGKPDLPGCSDCHSSHEITRTDATGFNLAVMDQCGNCHKDVVETYLDTYHGKASRLGKANAAKCYDCHGAHDILALNNPRSRLSKGNIVATCAKCHPRAHPGFKGYLTHATHYDSKKYPALFFAFWGMTGLLVATFAFFGCHTLLWLPTSWRMRKHAKELLAGSDPKAKHVLRFTIRQRAMHLIMIISFFGLALTGMTLKFSYMAWARFIAWMHRGRSSCGLRPPVVRRGDVWSVRLSPLGMHSSCTRKAARNQ